MAKDSLSNPVESDSLRHPAIIIVGSGRSGTSTIARLCHEELNICAGHFLKPADELNPKGYYEDLVSHGLVRAMVDNYTAETYLTLMNEFHKNCLLWLVKEPWTVYLSKQTLLKLTPRLCIVTIRDINATVTSWLKVYKAANPDGEITQQVKDHYYELTRSRQEASLRLADLWPNVISMDFTEHVSEDSIISDVRNGLAKAM